MEEFEGGKHGVCFVLYYYQVIGDRKTSKSLISNAPPSGQSFEFKCPTPGRALQENSRLWPGKGGMGTLGSD